MDTYHVNSYMEKNNLKKQINYALIGCGRISKKHLEAVGRIKDIKLYALCDIKNSILQSTGKKYGCSKLFNNFNELLNDTKIDLISICTPSGLHANMAIEAAKSGKNVILEKPMAMTVSDAKKILRAFAASKTSLSVMLQNRTNPPIIFLKKREKFLGKLFYVSANEYWYRKQNYYNDGWHGTAKMDGGVLMNQGTHYVDMVQYLVGSKVKEITAIGGTLGHKMECEDVISVNLKFSNGVLANIQANTLSYPDNFEGSVALFYEKATVKIGGKAMNKIIYWKGFREIDAIKFNKKNIEDIYGNGHFEVIKNMVENLLTGKKIFIPGIDGLPSLQIIETAYNVLNKKIINGNN